MGDADAIREAHRLSMLSMASCLHAHEEGEGRWDGCHFSMVHMVKARGVMRQMSHKTDRAMGCLIACMPSPSHAARVRLTCRAIEAEWRGENRIATVPCASARGGVRVALRVPVCPCRHRLPVAPKSLR